MLPRLYLRVSSKYQFTLLVPILVSWLPKATTRALLADLTLFSDDPTCPNLSKQHALRLLEHSVSLVSDLLALLMSTNVLVCGPDSLNMDVRNAVAAEQLSIVRGTSTCKEVFMHAESYR